MMLSRLSSARPILWPTINRLLAFIICLTLALGTSLGFAAELTFAQTTVSFNAPIEANGQDVTFSFRNDSDETFTITDVHNGCGCVTSTLIKRAYAPGESGALQVHVDFQNRTGSIKKIIRLTVRGSKTNADAEVPLKMEGVAQTPLTLSDLSVSWKVGEAKATKEIIVRVKEGQQISDLTVETPPLNTNFNLESSPLADGGCLIRVTPASSNSDTVTLVDGREVQQMYLLRYLHVPTKTIKRERFYAIVYK